jgi:transketolase
MKDRKNPVTRSMSHANEIDDRSLIERGYSVKKRFLAMYKRANAGHVGSSLSCADFLVFLRFAWMKTGDNLLLSKGHAAAALYSVLAEYGTLSETDIGSFYQDGTLLSAHPPPNKIKAIPFATGSLGHGLSLSAGMAVAARLRVQPRQFFCLTSDGELDEGSVWEAALFIAHRKLNNVIWLVDRNGLQGIGRTEDVLALEPLDAKLRAFGFYVANADGHDFASLHAAKHECEQNAAARQLPKAIICNTVKGRGLGNLQNTVACHYLPMKDEEYEDALVMLKTEYLEAMERSKHKS